MKKAISTLLLSTMMLASLQPMATPATAATAKATLTTRAELLAVSETVNGYTIPAGTLKVSLMMADNPGYGPCGIRIPFDANKLEVMKTSSGAIIKSKGPASENITLCVTENSNAKPASDTNYKNGIIGFGGIASEINKNNGVICSVYLKPKAGVNLKNESIKNIVTQPVVDKILKKDNTPVQHQEPKKIDLISETPPKKDTYTVQEVVDYRYKVTTYKLGDVSGDKKIDATDVQALLVMLKDSEVSSKKLNVNNRYSKLTYKDNISYNGMFFDTVEKAKKIDLKVADVNNDGYVDMDDAQKLLDYYTDVVVTGKKYNTKNGPEPGTTKQHVTKVYVIK